MAQDRRVPPTDTRSPTYPKSGRSPTGPISEQRPASTINTRLIHPRRPALRSMRRFIVSRCQGRTVTVLAASTLGPMLPPSRPPSRPEPPLHATNARLCPSTAGEGSVRGRPAHRDRDRSADEQHQTPGKPEPSKHHPLRRREDRATLLPRETGRHPPLRHAECAIDTDLAPSVEPQQRLIVL